MCHRKTVTGIFLSIIVLQFFVLFPYPVSAQTGLMRFPDIDRDLIVFVHGEDIWTVSAEGGIAQRITIHDGQERFPKFSPDGSLIAFTGEYDGNTDVYVMNRYGGNITRVTYHPGNDDVVGWHPTKNKIIFRANRNNFPRLTQLYMIHPDGTGLEQLIFHEAAWGSFSPDEKRMAYNKVGREFRTWKRYKGGTAQDIYLYNFVTNEEKKLTEFEGTDRHPMWIGDKIYFTSDRDRFLNLYCMDPQTGTTEQLTRHSDYDVRWPSMGNDKIVYELGAQLYVFDIITKTSKPVDIIIASDVPDTRPYIKNVKDFITDVKASPDGSQALIVARGDVFTVPQKDDITRNITKSPGANDKNAVWSPDGKHLATISDRSGEFEVYIMDNKGEHQAVQLTSHKNGYRHSLKWSPDSKKLAFTDQTLTLTILDIGTKKTEIVDKAEYENIDVSLDLKPIYDYTWSPDSRYIAYSKMDETLLNKIYIYSLDEKKSRTLSTIFYDFHPVFSKDGNYLFFVSNRRFDPTFCDIEWEMVYKDLAGIYYVTLRPDVPSLLLEKEKDPEKSVGKIDFNDISSRVEALPVEAGNYRTLSVNEEKLFYLNREKGDFNRFEFRVPEDMDLWSYDFKTKKTKELVKGIKKYDLSFDGSTLVIFKEDSVKWIKTGDSDGENGAFDLSDLNMHYDPRAEWKQIFNEAWRYERDFYYEPGMHGQDWNAVREKYGALIKLASCRQDVEFVVGEMIGELNTSHTYVYEGEYQRKSKDVRIGLLGADYTMDASSQRYQFKKVYTTPDWSRKIMPPLAQPGLNVKAGDYLLAVNGEKITTERNIYSYFQGLGDKEVILTVNSAPLMNGAREIKVTTLTSEYRIRYLDWVETNRLKVGKASGGKIGYIHLPDTWYGSALEFPKYFIAQSQKEGLIIDGRCNGGGLDPDIFLKRLMRKPHSYWTRRYSHDQTSPSISVNAHMACLTNRQAGSGGDELPHEFKYFNLGPVIGTTSWGGLVGVSMFISLIDGGQLTAPDYRIYDVHGNWCVENEGVTPDIIIDNHPKEMSRGYDAQLMKAVEVIMKKIEEEPRSWPAHPPFPVDK
ncbi:PD40 domain-containing protein [bacterium]|nr:PD40 domain-containing protein [bacterium]